MKKSKRFKGITACVLALLLAIPFASLAEDSARTLRPEELEQMLAPIALYPDALLAQVLTAATYPLEVVEANRFVRQSPGLKQEALLKAAKDKDWEPSVKAMLGFPDVLAMMDKELEWTKKIGEAFIVQQADCMDAVQRLRQQAYAHGNLKTSAEQVIVVEPETKIIVIKPRHAKIVYVPVYDPAIIYGVWWYPAYPPYRFYSRAYFGITFFPRISVGVFWGTWGCNWHHQHIYVNINHYKTFTKTYYHRGDHYRFYKAGQSIQPWKYDPRHHQIIRQRVSMAVTPSAPVIREYKQVTVRPATTITKEVSRPVIVSSTPRTKAQAKVKNSPSINKKKVESTPSVNIPTQRIKQEADIKKVPAPVVKMPATYRETMKAEGKVKLKFNKEEEKSAEVPVSNSKGPKVKKSSPGKGKAKGLALESIGKKVRGQVRQNRQDPAAKRASATMPEGLMNIVGR